MTRVDHVLGCAKDVGLDKVGRETPRPILEADVPGEARVLRPEGGCMHSCDAVFQIVKGGACRLNVTLTMLRHGPFPINAPGGGNPQASGDERHLAAPITPIMGTRVGSRDCSDLSRRLRS